MHRLLSVIRVLSGHRERRERAAQSRVTAVEELQREGRSAPGEPPPPVALLLAAPHLPVAVAGAAREWPRRHIDRRRNPLAVDVPVDNS